MRSPSGVGRAAVRSFGKLFEYHRQYRAVAPLAQQRIGGGDETVNVAGAQGGRWGQGRLPDEVKLMQRILPAATFWGRQLQPERGFLGIGDGDEDIGVAKHFEEDRVIGYTPEQVFDVVAGVDLYEDFVPWCQKSKVLWRTDDRMDAELEIGFKLFVERYVSHVELKAPRLIKTTVSQSNLFDFLNNEWHFKPGPTPETCHLFFVVDFQFKSPLYRRVANMFFNEVQARLVGSFEERCKVVYGPSLETVMR